MQERDFMPQKLLLILFIFFISISLFASQSSTYGHLVIGLDGVGFHTFQKMHKGGYFREFTNVAPMVATFPTISDPNWNHLTRTPVGRDFTSDKYFDLSDIHAQGKGRIKGSMLRSLKTRPWHKYFDLIDYNPVERLLFVGWTESSNQYLIDFFQRQILKIHRPIYRVYIPNPDMLAHTVGEKSVLKSLKHLDQTLMQIQRWRIKKYQKPLKITLISDHGNAYVEPKFIDYKKMAEKGWNFTKHLKNPEDVVLLAPEVLSFAALYCEDSKREALAKDMTLIEGVHLSAFSRNPSEMDIFSSTSSDQATVRGHVKVHINAKSKTLRYVLVSGYDPLGHFRYFQKSKTLTWREYLYRSLNDQYPYGAVSLWEGFYKNSQQSPCVLVSTHKEYAFANPLLKLVSKLKGRIKSLHGSLDRQQSLGFFASTHPIDTRVEVLTPHDFYPLISQHL